MKAYRYHETYEVPAGGWEAIYGNCRPVGLGALMLPTDEVDGGGKTKCVSILEDASKGKYRTAYGRMGRTSGNDNDKYGGESMLPEPSESPY